MTPGSSGGFGTCVIPSERARGALKGGFQQPQAVGQLAAYFCAFSVLSTRASTILTLVLETSSAVLVILRSEFRLVIRACFSQTLGRMAPTPCTKGRVKLLWTNTCNVCVSCGHSAVVDTTFSTRMLSHSYASRLRVWGQIWITIARFCRNRYYVSKRSRV